MPKLRLARTSQAGANRMLLDRRWHRSVPLSGWQPGDVLRVRNRDTGEQVDWVIASEPFKLAPEEARAEWEKYPLGGGSFWTKIRLFSLRRRAGAAVGNSTYTPFA